MFNTLFSALENTRSSISKAFNKLKSGRMSQEEIENILSEEFLKDSYKPGDIIELSIVDDKIQIIQDSKVESNKDA